MSLHSIICVLQLIIIEPLEWIRLIVLPVTVIDILTPADERTGGGQKQSFIRAHTTLGLNSFLVQNEQLVCSAAQHIPFA